MKLIENNTDEILKILFKEFNTVHTITSISEKLTLSRVGSWKLLKRLEEEKLIHLQKTGKGKTNAFLVKLNFDNALLEKKISLILLKESMRHQRWVDACIGLKDNVEMLILFGSTLIDPKTANDLDLLAVTNDNRFIEINSIVNRVQKSQYKKIHLITLTEEELRKELRKQNKAFLDAINKGIILFGTEYYIKTIKEVYRQ
jgi:hypothetical protein